MVGHVHATTVVDRVCVDSPSMLGKFDTGSLSQSEVSTFADDFASEFVSVDAQGVIGGVTGIVMGLMGCLHIRTDPTVPEQVGRYAKNEPNHGINIEFIAHYAQQVFHLSGQFDRLGLPAKDAAALADQIGVVFVPSLYGLEHP